MGKGDLGDVVGVPDTINQPVGSPPQRPITFAAWQIGVPTIGVGSVAAPNAQGGLNNDGGGGNKGDPDTYVGLFTLQTGASTLAPGTIVSPTGKGDVPDVFGTPDVSVSPPQKVAGFSAWATAASSLVPGSVAAPKGQGDVDAVGMSPTPKNEWNDSNQGAGTLITWNSGTPTLSVGSIPQVRDQGDIDAIYSVNEEWAGVNSTWSTGNPTLSVGPVLPITNGDGDVTNIEELSGINGIPSTSSWVLGLQRPVLAGTINGLSGTISLAWTSIGTQSPYAVFRSVNGGPFTQYQTNIQGFAYTDTGVVGTSTYSYYVESELPILVSNTVNLFAGIVPIVLTYVVNNAAINLSWNSVGVTTTYSVYRSINGGSFTLYQSGLTGLTYSDTALIRGNTYSYYIVSFFPQLQSNTVGPIVGQFTDSYTTSGTWTKRAGAYQISGVVIGDGAGGGAGAIQFQGNPGGGQGGPGGGYCEWFNAAASLFTASVAVTVGQGGLGALSTATLFGGSGTGSSFGSYAIGNAPAVGGQSNAQSSSTPVGGTATSTIPGAYTEHGGFGGAGTNGTFDINNGGSTTKAPGGGGGGGGAQVTRAGAGGAVGTLAGGLGGTCSLTADNTIPIIAGDGANGANGSSPFSGSGAGAGGSAGCTITTLQFIHAGIGGIGGGYGAGGGGGGSGLGSTNVNGGAGGNGKPGFVSVTTYLW